MATLIDQRTILPIINHFVSVPDEPVKRINPTTALSLIPGSYIRTFINQQHFVLPDFERAGGYPEDWFALLRAASV